jgi:hypothetical protein
MQLSSRDEQTTGHAPEALETLVEQSVPFFSQMAPVNQKRLRDIAANLLERSLPPSFIASSLRSTAQVLQEIGPEGEREGEPQGARADSVFQREEVQRFIQEHAITESGRRVPYQPRRERKREERERLHANTARLIREARLARGRHEVKKTRNLLLKVDQRELRRVLGKEGDELCRQINTWLRSTAAMF